MKVPYHILKNKVLTCPGKRPSSHDLILGSLGNILAPLASLPGVMGQTVDLNASIFETVSNLKRMKFHVLLWFLKDLNIFWYPPSPSLMQGLSCDNYSMHIAIFLYCFQEKQDAKHPNHSATSSPCRILHATH